MENKALTPKQRIQKLSIFLGISVRAIAKAVEMSEVTMYHITDGSRPITERTAAKISYHLERKYGVAVSWHWLMTGEGEMISDKPSVPQVEVEAEKDKAAEDRSQYIDYKAKYFALLEQYTELQGRYLSLLEKQQS